MRRLSCQWIALLLATLAAVAKGDFLNDYLDDKVFGVDPGPCPDFNRRCEFSLDTAEFPPSIGNIRFCLFRILFIDLFCDELKDWVQSGDIQIFELQCDRVAVDNVAVVPVSQNADTVVTRIDVDRARVGCVGRVNIIDAVLAGRVRLGVNAQTTFSTNGNRDGISMNFDLRLNAAGGFNDNLVDNAEVENCNFDADLGLSVSNTNDFSISILGSRPFGLTVFEDAVINLVLRILEAALGSILCQIAEQAGTLNDGSKGILNTRLDELNEIYDDLIEPVTIDIEGNDAAFQADPILFGSSDEERDLALNLADSNGLELVSVTLNDFLGDPTVDPLRINQAVNLVTDPDGEFFFDFTQNDEALSTTFPLDFADVTFTLNAATIVGLNTIKSLKFLDNDFSEGGNGLDFTLKHNFEIDNFQFLFTIDTTFKRGEWVTESACSASATPNDFLSEAQCTADQERFTFDFGLTVEDIFLEAATLTAFNFDEIQQIQIGQIFDKELSDFFAAAQSILNCIAPSVYVFEFSDLAMSVQNIRDPIVDNFSGQGVDDLVENSVDLFATLTQNLIANDLPALMRGPVREELNRFLRSDVSDVENLDNCQPYVQVPSINPHLNFSEPPIDAFFPIINDILGDFSANSDVDLNDFIQIVGEYYAENAEDFPLEPGQNIGDWETKANLIPLSNFKAFDGAFTNAATAFINVEQLQLLNLNTIDKFQSEAATDDKPHGFSVEIGFLDGNADALELTIGFHIFAPAPLNNNEKFDFKVRLQGIDFNVFVDELLVNLDSIQRLTLQQTTHLPCIQSTLDGFKADIPRSFATAQNINFDIIFDNAFTSTSGLRSALELLDQEFTNTNTRFTRLSNYLFEIGFESGLAGLEDANFSLTPEDCLDVETDLSFIISTFTGIVGFDSDFFNEQCLQEAPEIPPIGPFEDEKLSGRDEDLFFKWTENIFIDLLSGFLDVSSGNEAEDQGTVQNLLFTFAEAEGNFLVDLFKLEEGADGNATVTLQVPLNEDNVLLRILGLEPLSISNDDQFLAEVQFLRIKEVDRFLNQLRLFQTVGDYTLRHSIGFSEEDVLKVEIVSLLQVNAETVDEAPPGTPPIQEFITLEADLAGVTIDLEMFSALRSDLFKSLSVAHFFNVGEDQVFSFADTAFDCLLSTTEGDLVEIRELKVEFASIGTPVVTTQGNELVSPGVEAVLEEVTNLLLQFYASAVSRISQTCLRELANDELRIQVALAQGLCPVDAEFTEISEENEIFRFSDSQAYGEFQDFMVEVMYANNFEVLNLFIEGVTAEEFFDTNIFSTGKMQLSYKGEEYGELEINVTRLFIEGLNTMTDFRFFEPKSRNISNFDEENDPFAVVLLFNHSGPTTYNTREIITGFDFFTQAPVVTNDISLDFTFTNFHFSLEMILGLNLNSFMRIQFDQVDTFAELPCLLTPIRRLDIVDFEIQVEAIEVTFDCAGECEAPLLFELAGGPGSFSSDNTEELADVFQSAIAFAVRYLESSPAQQLIDVAIETSESNCDAIVEGVQGFLQPGAEDGDVFFYLLYVCIGVIFILGIAMGFQYPKHKKILAARIKEFEQNEEKKFADEHEITLLANELRALAWSPVVPKFFRIFTPILCFFNMIALTWAVTSQGALTILLTFTVVGLEMQTIDLVPFTVISTVNDLWFSGGWYLSIMIVGFSFLWPIVKNMGLLYLWYTPTTVMKADSRASWLEFLDVMGKWSFVDVFVVVMTLAALQTSISLSQNDELSFLDDTFFQTLVTMKPEIGIVMLSVVSVLSLVANHIMSYFHRKTEAHYKAEYDKISGNTTVPARAQKKKNMQKYKFAGRQTNTKKMKMLLFLNIFSGLLTVVGVFAPVVIFELRGVVALLLNQIDPDEVFREYSVFSLGILLFEAAPQGFDEQIVIALFVFLYFAVAIIGPLVQIVVLHVIMTKKFNLANFSTMIYLVMLVSFWTALDVVLIGVGATLLQITNVTDFIINFITNDICTNIQGVLVTFVPDEQNDSCLEIVGFWGYGAIPLLFGTVGQLITHGIIMVMATRMKQDWYYFAYVLHGHRKRESKPKKLPYFRDRVYKYFTFRSRKKKQQQPVEELETLESEVEHRGGLSAANPRFSPKVGNGAPPSANFSEGLSGSGGAQQSEIRASNDIFAQMEKPPKRSPMPPGVDDVDV